MPSKASNTQQTNEAAQKREAAHPAAQDPVALTQQADLGTLQRTAADPRAARPSDILALQRTVGNQAVLHLLGRASASPGPRVQFKLTVGPASDRYEQEANRVAEQVMNMPAAGISSPSAAGEAGDGSQPVQRQAPEEEEVQTKPLAASITPLVQRQEVPEEEEVQTQSLVQRQEAPEDEEVQTKSLAQRRADGSFEAGSDIEQRLAINKGSGGPLPSEVRDYMEPRFGVDFSGVRVHTGGEAAQLNRAVSAQAFTHGQDIYLGEGKYAPGTDAGKQLLAHELTHVLQQSGAIGVAQRLMSVKEWKSKSSLFGRRRSTDLKAIDAALAAWHQAKDDADIQKRSNALDLVKQKIEAWQALKGKNKKRALRVAELMQDVNDESRKLTIIRRIHDTYGITLRQKAGVEAIQQTYSKAPKKVRQGLTPKDWTLTELQDVETALSHYKALLGPQRTKQGLGAQPITTFSRLKQGIDVNKPTGKLDTSTAGETFRQSENISMFDVGTQITDFAADKSAPTEEELRKGFRGTIIHELSHGLVEAALSKLPGGRTIIRQFLTAMKFWDGNRYASAYWRPAGKRYDDDDFDAAATRQAASSAGVEIPITGYGMKNANEDLAETMMFYFEDPGKLQTKCPERFTFVQANIKPLLDPSVAKKKAKREEEAMTEGLSLLFGNVEEDEATAEGLANLFA